MIKKIFKSKRGEGYIDIAIGVVCIAAFIALTLNIFTFVSLKTTLDRITDDLIEVATYTGTFGSEFDDRVQLLQDQYFDFTVEYYADFYNSTYKRVQIGEEMGVRVTINAQLAGFGFALPFNVSVTRVGLSEHYWKTASSDNS